MVSFSSSNETSSGVVVGVDDKRRMGPLPSGRRVGENALTPTRRTRQQDGGKPHSPRTSKVVESATGDRRRQRLFLDFRVVIVDLSREQIIRIFACVVIARIPFQRRPGSGMVEMKGSCRLRWGSRCQASWCRAVVLVFPGGLKF